MNNFMQWYAIGAILFTMFGMYRAFKYNIEHDELMVLSWILIWPIWLLAFILSKIFK